jgi:hypothetical protein
MSQGKPKITVLDCICGKGKTSYAIQWMNEHPERSFIYVAPLLSEIERVKASYRPLGRQSTTAVFYEPTFSGGRKLDSFNALLSSGVNIATTHSTFTNANAETIEAIRNGGYTLILDEVIDIIAPYNDVVAYTDRMTKGDVGILLHKKLIDVDKHGRVTWIDVDYHDDHFQEVRRLAQSGNLILVNGCLFLWEFPVEMFRACESVLVCTYLFDGSFLKYYFQYHGLEYRLAGIEKIDDVDKSDVDKPARYRIAPYRSDVSERAAYKALISVCDDKKLNDYPRAAFSSTWCKANLNSTKRQNAAKYNKATTRIRNALYNYFRNKQGAEPSSIAWTSYKVYRRVLEMPGYTRTRRLTDEEKQLPPGEVQRLQDKLSCFVPCNARASNDYRERSVLAYLCNMGVHPFIRRFFELKGIEVDADAFALGCLIQWVWRSAIRDGKPVSLYLPSPRMRKLLDAWLNPASCELAA